MSDHDEGKGMPALALPLIMYVVGLVLPAIGVQVAGVWEGIPLPITDTTWPPVYAILFCGAVFAFGYALFTRTLLDKGVASVVTALPLAAALPTPPIRTWAISAAILFGVLWFLVRPRWDEEPEYEEEPPPASAGGGQPQGSRAPMGGQAVMTQSVAIPNVSGVPPADLMALMNNPNVSEETRISAEAVMFLEMSDMAARRGVALPVPPFMQQNQKSLSETKTDDRSYSPGQREAPLAISLLFGMLRRRFR